MSTASEWGSPRSDATLDRAAAWACAASTAAFLVVVASVAFTTRADDSLKDYVTGEPALAPALFLFVSLALASAALAHRPIWRHSLVAGAVGAVFLAVSAAQFYEDLWYIAVAPAALALVSTALAVQVARVVLLLTAGGVALLLSAQFILPLAASVVALTRGSALGIELWRKSRSPS